MLKAIVERWMVVATNKVKNTIDLVGHSMGSIVAKEMCYSS